MLSENDPWFEGTNGTLESSNVESGDPSPERIRELTAEIRRKWTPWERRLREGISSDIELLEMPVHPRRRDPRRE